MLSKNDLFTLSKNYKSSYLVPLEKFKSEIDGKENIAIPLVIDSEFVAPGIDTFLNPDNPFGSRRGVTVQVKHALYDDAKIYLHPDFEPEKPRHDPITQPFIVGDYLIQKGYDVEMYRADLITGDTDYIYDDDDLIDSANYNDQAFQKLPSLLVVLYAHFALADLGMVLFDQRYIDDLTEKYSYKTGGIEMGRRLTCGQSGRTSFNWIIKINGFEYRIALKIVDTAALHGVAGYKQVCANSGIELNAKDLVGDYITKMDVAYSEIPVEFDAYSLGDLRVYDMLAANAKNMSTVWRDLGIIDRMIEPKLTIGATVASLILAKIFELLDVPLDVMRSSEIDEFLEPLTFKASAAYLSTEVNSNAYLLSKCDGGRCKNNDPTQTGLSGELDDIDISGAYSSAMSVLDYPLGTPVILATPYNKTKNVGVSLKNVLRAYSGELLPNLWVMRIQVTGLSFEQDLIASWFDFARSTTKHTDSSVTGEVDLESGTSKIFTTEIINGALTSDLLDVIDQWTPRQRDDFYSKCEVLAIAFYPKSFELSIDDFKNNPLEKTFRSNSQASNGFELITQSNHNWTRVNFGSFFTDLMRAKRKQHESKTPLNELYKLTGNTSYGVSVSRFFNTSNMIVGNNITAKVRAFMYMTEKSLNLCGSVTDGHIFDLNNVLHRKDGLYLKTESLARLYSIPKWQIKNNNSGEFAPLARSVRTCDYQTAKGLENDKTAQKQFENDQLEINRAALDHVGTVWHKSPLLHNEFNVLTPVDGRVLYKKAKGVFTFEMKRFADRVTLHGSSNYSFDYNDPENTKMRGYESKNKPHQAFVLVDGELTRIDDYAVLSPGQCLMREITNNPAAVKRLPPFVKTAILKPTAFANEYRNKWRKSVLTPGDNILKVGKPSYFSLSAFTYRSYAQFTAFKKATEKLKRKYGESFEIFFTNDDDTINYKKMIVEMDKLIRDGVINPLKVLDKHNNLHRLKSPLASVYHATSKDLKQSVLTACVGDDDDDYEYIDDSESTAGFDL
jgi:hypothetical protein